MTPEEIEAKQAAIMAKICSRCLQQNHAVDFSAKKMAETKTCLCGCHGDRSGWVGFDFDRTLVHYQQGDYKRQGKTHIREPIMSMVKRTLNLIQAGYSIKILTARDIQDPEIAQAINEWSLNMLGTQVPLTQTKDPHMICLFDDRAIAVMANDGRILGYDQQLQDIIDASGGISLPVYFPGCSYPSPEMAQRFVQHISDDFFLRGISQNDKWKALLEALILLEFIKPPKTGE